MRRAGKEWVGASGDIRAWRSAARPERKGGRARYPQTPVQTKKKQLQLEPELRERSGCRNYCFAACVLTVRRPNGTYSGQYRMNPVAIRAM